MSQKALLKKQAQQNRLLSKDKKLNERIQNKFFHEKVRKERNKINNLLHNFAPGYMEAEEGQCTAKVTQKQIEDMVNVQTCNNSFELQLAMGTYRCGYSRNGSTLMLASSMGHTCLINWRDKEPILDINLRERLHDGVFLHNDEMFALCQPSHTYIYDNRGIQLHRLDYSLGLEYLPHHFLLVGYDQKKLKYYDTTTGHIIADHVAKNPYTVMRQNPSNGVIGLGSGKGTVEWWTPGVGKPALKMFVGAAVTDIAFHQGYMYTAADTLKLWDARMLKEVYSYPLYKRIPSMAMSQSGLLALNHGYKLDIFKQAHLEKPKMPYMTYNCNGTTINCNFVPFEDLMGLGTNSGFTSIIVPGSGVPFYDSFQNNPFQTKKQKRESLVHRLMEKLPLETITVDPNIIGNIDKTKREILEKEQKEEADKIERKNLEKKLKKKKMRGKGSIKNRLTRKSMELEKKKRAELTKVINTKLWAKWAQKKKKQKELKLIEKMGENGFSIAQLGKKKPIQKGV